MDLIREKQLHVFLIVFNLCSWPIKYKKNVQLYLDTPFTQLFLL